MHPVIKGDVLHAINAFYNIDSRGFRCINPKIPDAKEAKDYRPISLIHSFPKLLAKLLANRLSTTIDDMILCNQSAFIRGRYILDNFKYVQRAAVLIKKKKNTKASVGIRGQLRFILIIKMRA